jgi:transposase
MSDPPVQRFIAFDLHKSYAMVGGVGADREVVLQPRRVAMARLDGWVAKGLRASDAVVIEAGPNTWFAYDLIAPCVQRAVVANPHDVKLIAASAVKTDRRDVLVLARLLAVDMIPEVWVPPPHVRELRRLIVHRRALTRQRTAAKNRLRSVLLRHRIAPPEGNPFAASNRPWWDSLPVGPVERLCVGQDLRALDGFGDMIVEAETALSRMSVSEVWADQVPYLIQLPGFGLVTAMTVLGAVGDITRFPSAKKLVGYSGLGARVHASGQTHRSGGITKRGRRELRTALIEAAWIAAANSDYWGKQFKRLSEQAGRNKAIAAIARKLLVVVWHVLTAKEADRQADAAAVARSFMNWGTRHRTATTLGLRQTQFVRRELDRLGLGKELTSIRYSGCTVKLPEAS